jgi:molybdenum cofactor cytidylyltransferase
MRPVVHILVLAAGASSRMRGRDKLLQHIDGRPMLRLVVETALATRAPVAVTLPPTSEARHDAIAELPVKLVEVPDASEGMSRSLVRGIAAISAGDPGPQDGIMILPADMPGFTAEILSDLISQFQADPDLILRGGTAGGTPGHPAIFPRCLWPELSGVTGDEGGRSILQRNRDRVRVIPLPGQMAILDLDTPEDWAAYLGHPLASC